jgi:hypothetical protein
MSGFALLLSALVQTAAPTPAAAQTAAPQTASAIDSEKIVCKKRPKTGSLAGVEKVCHTKADWDRIQRMSREAWEEVQGAKGSSHGG